MHCCVSWSAKTTPGSKNYRQILKIGQRGRMYHLSVCSVEIFKGSHPALRAHPLQEPHHSQGLSLPRSDILWIHGYLSMLLCHHWLPEPVIPLTKRIREPKTIFGSPKAWVATFSRVANMFPHLGKIRLIRLIFEGVQSQTILKK